MASLHCTDALIRPFLSVFSAKADLSLISAEVLYKGIGNSKAEEKHPSSMFPHGITLGGHRDRESDMHREGSTVRQELQRPGKRMSFPRSHQEMYDLWSRSAPARAVWSMSGDSFCCHTGQGYCHLVGGIHGAVKYPVVHTMTMKPGGM